MEIREQVPLSTLTTFRIGGPARYCASVSSFIELTEALAFARERALPVVVIGQGSNVLASDEGFPGLVIHMGIEGITAAPDGDVVLVSAGAGVVWDELVSYTCTQGLWGIENLSGIPGTVGGAVVQNIGAYGAALSQTLVRVEVFDTQRNAARTVALEECAFSYRTSVFKQTAGRYIVLGATLRLHTAPRPNLSYQDPNKAYKDIARVLGENTDPTLADIRTSILAIRADKFPDLTREGTAGSFFENAILPEPLARTLQAKFPGLPVFSMPETSDLKVPMGWILDHVLQARGHAKGNARLFERQAMVVVTTPGALAREVDALAEDITKKVFDATGIVLKREVCSLRALNSPH